MQSAPLEVSQTATSENHLQDPSSDIYHGLSADADLVPDGRSDRRLDGEPSDIDPPDDASVASSATSRGRRSNLRRMSSRNDSGESSPGSRIDAYERANAIPRRPSDGMVFQVIPSTGNSGTSVLDMPNGKPETVASKAIANFIQRCLHMFCLTFLQSRYP